MRKHIVRKTRMWVRAVSRVFRVRAARRVVGLGVFLFTLSGALGVIYYLTQETKAVAGAYAVYRESTGFEAINTTASDLGWDTTVSSAALFSIDAGRTNITLSEAGHYLALYNIGVEVQSGTVLAETQGYLFVNGAQSNYGRSSCTMLNQNGHTECWMSGATIIETTAVDQAVKIQAQRTDSGGTNTRRSGGDSGVTLVRLDDSWEFARIREAGGGQSLNGGWTTVSLDTDDELDTAVFSRTDGDITLGDAARYLVTTQVHFKSSEINKTRAQGTRLTLDGTEIAGTRVTANLLAESSAQDAVATFVGVIETTSANQVLRLQGACLSEDCGNVQTVANGTTITIVRLADTVETVGLTETTGGQQVYATDDPITWDTQTQISSEAFSHSTTTNASRITVLEDDDYLFLSTFYTEGTDTISAIVMDPHWAWRKNGSGVLSYGSFDQAIPGEDGQYGAFISGASGGAVYGNLAANDYVEVVNTNETSGTLTDRTFQGGVMGVQGIRLSTLQEPDVTVSSLGSQTAAIRIPTSDAYVGGLFAFQANEPNQTVEVSSVTITETGTVDAANDITNVRLYYEYDTTNYDCSAVSYDGNELQYGATSTSFSAENGSSTFSGALIASTTQAACVYAVFDVASSAADGQSVEIEITNTADDVVLSNAGPVGPSTSIALVGTTLLADDVLIQKHYHWRLDDGTEATASSATGGVEDAVLSDLPKNNEQRLRMQVSNEGSTSSPAVQYRLEYAQRAGSCAATTGGWTDVGAVGGAWDMFTSGNLVDGTNTTNIAGATGGVTDENESFYGIGTVKDLGSQTAGITATSGTFIEFEYSVVATANAVDGESYCFRLTDAGTPLASYEAYPEVSIAADVLVSSLGSHTATVDASTTDFYVGGSWVITDQSGSRDVTEITIHEVGTVDAQNDLSNIRLYYDIDTSATPDCSAESFSFADEQYGATSSAFSAVNGSSTFTDVVGISTTDTMCVYAVVDVGPGAENGQIIEFEMSNPGIDVVVSTGSVNPNTPVGPTGSSTIEKAVLEQVHYHWRNDDGTEAGASSATGGTEDTGLTNVKRTETVRLRTEITNTGGTSTIPTVFTLEYAERSGSCDASSGWSAVGSPGAEWVMSDSVNLTQGDNTTNIGVATGGVTDENLAFLTPNGGVLDTQATSSPFLIAITDFIELEYSIEATTDADFGTTYCFRLVGNGSAVSMYDTYPVATIRQNQDFYIQRGVSTIPGGATDVSIVAGVDYVAPSATTTAFIRITNTMSTGAGANSGGSQQNGDLATAYVSNPENLLSGITFSRAGSTNNTRVYWEIIEYTGPSGGDNEVLVRTAAAFETGANTLTENIAVDGVVDDNDVVVFLTGQANQEANALEYHTTAFTTDWNGVTDEAVFEREDFGPGAGNPGLVSYAVVEFTGQNWLIQRSEHTYTAAGTIQTQAITGVNDLERAFIHAQHRTDQATVADYGHLVWLSAVNTVSYQLNSNATIGVHVSVAWVIENTQTNGTPMVVTRSNGNIAPGGTEPGTYSIAIGKTIAGLDVASIFATVHSAGADQIHPRAIMGARIASTTHYELWISDTGSARSYRTEIVEWPTAVLTIRQNYYRFYIDNDALEPTDQWPPGATNLGENTAITVDDEPPVPTDRIRIRMSLNVTGANISQASKQFQLEYGVRETTCTAIGTWYPIGDTGSTTAVWRGYNGSPLDGTALSTNPSGPPNDVVLSVSDRAGTYEEQNPTAVNPYKIIIGEDVEYDWLIEANATEDFTSYCFRMVESDGAPLQDYLYYPTITTAGFVLTQYDWRWFDDETNLTPTVPLAGTNTAPSNVVYDDPLKLRVVVNEEAGLSGPDTKFKLQWSEVSDFTTANDVTDIDSCDTEAVWCYADGAGVEQATITARTLFSGDSCVAGVGDGCGTHTEYSYVPAIVGEVGTTTADSGGTLVTLQHTYDDPIYIVEAVSGDSGGGAANDPAAAIITATTTSSFTVRIQEPDNEADDHGVEEIAYIVMERGAYTLPDGRRVDVDSMDTTSYYGNAVAGASDDTCTFTQSFGSAPVVLTALQTDNNTGTPDFLTVSQALVTANDFACSIEVPDGETNAPSSSETIGWIAMEGGSWTNNSIDLIATTTAQSVAGWSDMPWYEELFPYSYFTKPPGLLGSKQTRNGAEGGWLRYDGVNEQSALLSIDERDDGERAHADEVVGYLAMSEGGVLYRGGSTEYVFPSGAGVEFEFTLIHNNARPNQTYFFRLYDVSRDAPVVASTSANYPSLSAEGAQLTFSIGGFSAGSTTEGVTFTATTTATSVPFGVLTLGVDEVTGQRLTVSTNATDGYQLFIYETQDLTAANGATIADITSTNAAPAAWASACASSAASCYGYHTGDNTLEGGSSRFLLDDTYAALTSTLAEIAYSSGPVTAESTDVVYRIRANASQPAGRYESNVRFIVTPVF